jgi:hypothetical protein
MDYIGLPYYHLVLIDCVRDRAGGHEQLISNSVQLKPVFAIRLSRLWAQSSLYSSETVYIDSLVALLNKERSPLLNKVYYTLESWRKKS